MWSNNLLTEKLGIEWPILQAPMAEFTTPELAAAVSNAGGMGSLGMWNFSAPQVAERISGFRQLSDGPLNVNYPLWEDPGDLEGVGMPMRDCLQAIYQEAEFESMPLPSAAASQVDPDHLDVLTTLKPEAISFHFGLPDREIVDTLKAAGINILCSATTVAEAKTLESRGVDVIIAQGTEAGGHRGTFSDADITMQSGLISLLPQVVDAVSVPVIAAGGIADGRGVAATLMLGASGVLIGTAFLRCDEANVPVAYATALANGKEATTQISDLVSGKNARFITNKLLDDLISAEVDPLPFPAQYSLTLPLGKTEDIELTDLLSGQSVALTRAMPAAELVRILAAETSQCLQSFT